MSRGRRDSADRAHTRRVDPGGQPVEFEADRCCFYWISIKDPEQSCYKIGRRCSSFHENPSAPILCNNLNVGQILEVHADICLDQEDSECREDAVTQPIVLKLGVLSCPDVADNGKCACIFTPCDNTHVESVQHCGGTTCSIVTILDWVLGVLP